MHPLLVLHRQRVRGGIARRLGDESTPLQEATDPTTPTARVDALAISSDDAVAYAAASNPNLSAAMARKLCHRQDRSDALERNPARPLWWMEDPELAEHMAYYMATFTSDTALLRQLVGMASVRVRQAVTRNKHTPRDVLVTLSLDPDFNVQFAVVEVISASKYPSSAMWINLLRAENPHAKDIFDFIASEASEEEIDEDRYFALITSNPDATVRRVAALNPNAPALLLRDLSKDSDESVRKAAKKTLKARKP